jgi:uncharacterized protein (DUF983 family)
VNDLAIIAQAGLVQAVGSWAIAAILIAGIVGIFLVFCSIAKVSPPEWMKTIAWIILGCILCVLAIHFLMKYSW